MTLAQYYARQENEFANTTVSNALRQDKILIEQLYIKRGQPLGPGKALQWFEQWYTAWTQRNGVRNFLEEGSLCMAQT